MGRVIDERVERSELICVEVCSPCQHLSNTRKEVPRTRGCFTSTSCNTASSLIALDLISRAIAAGACSGIRYMEAIN